MTFKHLLRCTILLIALPAVAQTLPFWGEDSSATNRTCASAQAVALSSDFESRLCATEEVFLSSFSSRPIATLITVK
jgi:hypothetical protein